MPLEFVDTHCHLDFNKFDNDRDEVVIRAQTAGLSHMLIPGITIESSRIAIELSENNPALFAAIGIQPNDAMTWNDNSIGDLTQLYNSNNKTTSLKRKKIVAIGEIGLDYYWDAAPQAHQKRILWEQLQLASKLNLPVILHLREKKDAVQGPCSEDLLEILTDWRNQLISTKNLISIHPGVLHSFSGNIDTAQKAIQLGFFIGVTGPVTFINAKNQQDLIAAIPLERLLLETDSPFLTPHPNRGQRNEPANIKLVATKVAELHKESLARVAEQTCINAEKLFNW
ncbi:MAG: TatD family hydrolase [Chloroflexota bacterium]